MDREEEEGKAKKRQMDCVTNDKLEKGVDDAMTVNRGECNGRRWRVAPTPNKMG